MDTLEAQAALNNCELVAHGRVGSTPRGWFYLGSGSWTSDVANAAPIDRATLIAFASSGHELTITGVPVGCGTRMGIDRDRDGYRDGDELAAGTDPGDPASHPLPTGVAGAPGVALGLRAIAPNPFKNTTAISYALPRDGEVRMEVFDVLGRTVRTLAHGERQVAGTHRLTWDGHDDSGRALGSGLYFVRLRSLDRSWQRPVLIVR
jgi:hypothetical protein